MTTPPATPEPPAPRQPWDRLPDEPGPCHVRFTLFRNLGPGRTIDAAYRLVRRRGGKGEQRRRASGCWYRAARRYRWQERAAAWDLTYLREAGAHAVAKFVSLIADMATKTLERIRSENLHPESWADVIATVQALGQHVPPETILSVSEAGIPGRAAPP